MARVVQFCGRRCRSSTALLCAAEDLDRRRRRVARLVAAVSVSDQRRRHRASDAAVPRAATERCRDKPGAALARCQRLLNQVRAGSAHVQLAVLPDAGFALAVRKIRSGRRAGAKALAGFVGREPFARFHSLLWLDGAGERSWLRLDLAALQTQVFSDRPDRSGALL